MIDNNIQQCFIKSLMDTTWLTTCNFVNLYSENDSKSNSITCVYLSDDKTKLLYVTNKLFATDKATGLPWSQKYEKFLKSITLNEIISTTFSYSGLFFSEYLHNEKLQTLKEYMLCNPYDSSLFCGYIKNIIQISKYHLVPFCFSEELLLVDLHNNLLIPSHNFIFSITHPLPLDICKMFKSRLHPLMLIHLNKLKTNGLPHLKTTKSIVKSGLYSPLKMKKVCTHIIEKEASLDRIYFLSTFIYYFATIATFWKLQKRFIVYNNNRNSKKSVQSKHCLGICSHSLNYLGGDVLKDIIHNYLCIEVIYTLPVKLKKATELYPCFNTCLMQLEGYLVKLHNVPSLS